MDIKFLLINWIIIKTIIDFGFMTLVQYNFNYLLVIYIRIGIK